MPFDQYGMPGNPYDAKQLVEYLKSNPSEAAFLTWTLNIELTPVYAIAPMGGAFDIDVYKKLITFLENHISPSSDDQHISRISIPGVLSNKPTRLFSGQIVPTIVPQARGMWGWKTQSLINAAKKSCDFNKEKSEKFDNQLKNFLERIYYELHNLGESSSDRALNYAATNVVQVASILKDGSDKYQLDRISVEKSKFCRMDSDCWDIKLIFFQTKSLVKPRKIYRFTIDVSDSLPVTVGKVKKWYSSS